MQSSNFSRKAMNRARRHWSTIDAATGTDRRYAVSNYLSSLLKDRSDEEMVAVAKAAEQVLGNVPTREQAMTDDH